MYVQYICMYIEIKRIAEIGYCISYCFFIYFEVVSNCYIYDRDLAGAISLNIDIRKLPVICMDGMTIGCLVGV